MNETAVKIIFASFIVGSSFGKIHFELWTVASFEFPIKGLFWNRVRENKMMLNENSEKKIYLRA